MKPGVVIIVVLLLCSAYGTGMADVYIWTDDMGVKHYSKLPPENKDVKGLKVIKGKTEINHIENAFSVPEEL